jgi:hypothetical protein
MPEPEAAPAPASAPPQLSKRPRDGQEAPVVPNEVILDNILTRVPAAATIRFQAVCRDWRAALTSDHFAQARQNVRAAAAHPPEIVFLAPAATASSTASSTAFYSCSVKSTTPQNGSSSPAAARELVTVVNLRAKDLVLSGTKPCRGLTLLFQPGESAYHVCNLSTGEHVSMPPCEPANSAPSQVYSPYVLSSTGLGFDPSAGEHVVVRLFEDWRKQQRCEVYGLRSGGWRPLAGRVPPYVAKGLNGRPPVFLDLDDGGCFFYWHINTAYNFSGIMEEMSLRTPEPILSLCVGTGQFGWVRPPEERARHPFHLAELDGDLCAVVDLRFGGVEQYELWVRTTAPPPSWSLRCLIGLASLPRPMREALGRGFRVLPLGSSGGKILLATSRHEVYAYDPDMNSVDRVFSVQEFMDAPSEPVLSLLNIAMYEETVTGVRRRPVADGNVGKLKMKLGRSTVARRRGGTADEHRDDSR